jgi:signal transduction histidine kinase
LRTRHHLALQVCEPTCVSGDAAAIREALRNLLENAIRHTPPGTEIKVTVGPAGSIVVEDNGPGVAAAWREANRNRGELFGEAREPDVPLLT